MKLRLWICFGVTAGMVLANSAWAGKVALLSFAQGQLPNDTGSDGLTKFSIEENKELGGAALKVDFAPSDSVGVRSVSIKNWKPFTTVEFSVFNPTGEKINLGFNVAHKRSTSFQTRVEAVVALKPGRNDVRIGVDEMLNINGSAPDLANVVRWYIANGAAKPLTLFFSDLCLVGDDTATAGTAPAPSNPSGAAVLAGNYRIKGKIGDMPVDLTMTPDNAASSPTTKVRPGPVTDPTRLERIRAARPPALTVPIPFDAPEAEVVLAGLEVYPPDNAWNQLVTNWPVHPNSKALVASVGNDKPLRCNADMGFVLVPPGQKRVEVRLKGYAGESDAGPYPVPDNIPIEGWPADYRRNPKLKTQTLDDVQRDKLNLGGDRHALVVDPVNRMLYEFYTLRKTDTGWEAAQASIFDLKSNALRPEGWTSSDAAGLPVFPAVVRYDELQRGQIDHALRVTIRKSRREFIAPATHYASSLTDENLPRMGERFRLRQDFDVSGFSPSARTILIALKRYGMFVADNGIEWALSVAPDERIPALHEEMRRVKGSDFEVVIAP